jgi:hypothetical protein
VESVGSANKGRWRILKNNNGNNMVNLFKWARSVRLPN